MPEVSLAVGGDVAARLARLHERAVAAYAAGSHDPGCLVAALDAHSELAALGLTPQVVFDFVEDFAADGMPTKEEFVAVASLRHAWFRAKREAVRPEIPGRDVAAYGIRWLPRITTKARRFLEGTLPEDLMFGCGGDRAFLRSRSLTLEGFLRCVAASEKDDDVFRRVAGT